MKTTQVARLLAYVSGLVNQQLLLQNEYLLAENRILRAQLPSRLLLTDPERSSADRKSCEMKGLYSAGEIDSPASGGTPAPS